jgi:hypothetical protein
MVRNIENGLALIENWLRNKNTIEFLGIWEQVYNPDFNPLEFEGIKNMTGLNRFIVSVKQWTERTNSRGIIVKAGRYGGTCAHKDIAFEFASWVSSQFKLYLIREFQRLKAKKQNAWTGSPGASLPKSTTTSIRMPSGNVSSPGSLPLNRHPSSMPMKRTFRHTRL